VSDASQTSRVLPIAQPVSNDTSNEPQLGDGAVSAANAFVSTEGQSRACFDPRLMIWLSPAFPVGAFAYSHGLEWAAERGWIRGQAGLTEWLRDLVRRGSVRNDLVFLARAWRFTRSASYAALADANALALALQPSAERHLETTSQGNAFLAAIGSAWPCPALDDMLAVLGTNVAYPVAVGAVGAVHGIACPDTMRAFAVSAVSNLASAAIRLSIIGQTDGQRTIAALLPDLDACSAWAEQATLDDVGGVVYRSDLASLAHETQYTRLFRS
jgi:urease accessory protein